MSYFKHILRRELNKPKNAEVKKVSARFQTQKNFQLTEMLTDDYFTKEEPKPKETGVIICEREDDDHLFKHPGECDVLSAVNVNVRVDNWLHNQLGIYFLKILIFFNFFFI